ncbi:hypothetical protein [Methylovirgula sp. 4M-Z18]|uniref:hypothetical protein n=1 Tax=Methylovirgula sp. 4M-Z18 TaxID=2293567 RepID=UPI0013148B9A|nr:hypothetical protein [Methylovirgula sp. 4M-Z18]
MRGDAAAGAQDGAGLIELKRGDPDAEIGIAEDEVFGVDEIAGQPEAGGGVGEMLAGDPSHPDGAVAQPLIQSRQGLLGRRHGAGELRPGEGLQREMRVLPGVGCRAPQKGRSEGKSLCHGFHLTISIFHFSVSISGVVDEREKTNENIAVGCILRGPFSLKHFNLKCLSEKLKSLSESDSSLWRADVDRVGRCLWFVNHMANHHKNFITEANTALASVIGHC